MSADGQTSEYERLVQVNNIAVDLCNADDTYDHHDQTDDHPCSRCLRYAETVERIVVAVRADERQQCVEAVLGAFEAPRSEAWAAYLNGPGGKTEALRQGKYDGLDRGLRLAVNAINRRGNTPAQPGGAA